MYLPVPPYPTSPPAPPQNLGQTRSMLKTLAEAQSRNLQNYADIKVIEQQNAAIRSALGDILRLTAKPIQTRAGKNAYIIEPSTKFSSPIPEARYLVDLAKDALNSP